MHELAVAREIVGVAERHAGGLAVSVVRVKVGCLRQVVPEYLGFYFEVCARDTSCGGAELEWERIPSLLRCGACGAEWDPAPPPARADQELLVDFRCPGCRGGDHSVISGDELVVESIEVEEPAADLGRDAAATNEPAGG